MREEYVLEDRVVADEQLHELLLDLPGLLLEDEVQPIDVELGVLFEVYILDPALNLPLADCSSFSAHLLALLPALARALRLLLALEGGLAPLEVVIPHADLMLFLLPSNHYNPINPHRLLQPSPSHPPTMPPFDCDWGL